MRAGLRPEPAPEFTQVRIVFELLHEDKVVGTYGTVLETNELDMTAPDVHEWIAAACVYHALALWTEIVASWGLRPETEEREETDEHHSE